jgi:hypothetical protein
MEVMKTINPDNLFGSKGHFTTEGQDRKFVPVESAGRGPFVNPTKGKTKRKKIFPPKGTKTNIGDPCKSSGGGKRK